MAGFVSRLFHLGFLLKRPMTLGARCIALNAEGKVMLVRHSYVPGWHLPGGGIEPGETALDCAERELLEETNCIFGDEPKLFGFYFNRQASRRDHVAVYICTNVTQSSPKTPDREILEAGFFDPLKLPDETSKASARRINEYLSGSAPDRFW